MSKSTEPSQFESAVLQQLDAADNLARWLHTGMLATTDSTLSDDSAK